MSIQTELEKLLGAYQDSTTYTGTVTGLKRNLVGAGQAVIEYKTRMGKRREATVWTHYGTTVGNKTAFLFPSSSGKKTKIKLNMQVSFKLEHDQNFIDQKTLVIKNA